MFSHFKLSHIFQTFFNRSEKLQTEPTEPTEPTESIENKCIEEVDVKTVLFYFRHDLENFKVLIHRLEKKSEWTEDKSFTEKQNEICVFIQLYFNNLDSEKQKNFLTQLKSEYKKLEYEEYLYRFFSDWKDRRKNYLLRLLCQKTSYKNPLKNLSFVDVWLSEDLTSCNKESITDFLLSKFEGIHKSFLLLKAFDDIFKGKVSTRSYRHFRIYFFLENLEMRDLKKIKKADLLKIPNIGKKSAEELFEVIKAI